MSLCPLMGAQRHQHIGGCRTSGSRSQRGGCCRTWSRGPSGRTGRGGSPAGAMGATLSPALLLAVRINGKGREVLYLAKGDSVKLGCPYVLEPEDNGPQGVGIEWIQITPERPSPENVVSGAGRRLPGWRGGSRQSLAGQAGQAQSGRAGMEQAGQGCSRQDRDRQFRHSLAGQGWSRTGRDGPGRQGWSG